MTTCANKTACIHGNLKNGAISYNCYPADEFSKGQWYIGISAVSFKSSVALAVACAITSNFVKGQRRTPNGDIVFYQVN